MLKLISVSSLLYYVQDVAKTKPFYETIGFQFEKKDDRVVTYLNWFSIEFRQAEKPMDNACGEVVYIKVSSLDELQAKLKTNGIKTDGEPQDVGGGVRELQVRDPDGYRLTFFEKK